MSVPLNIDPVTGGPLNVIDKCLCTDWDPLSLTGIAEPSCPIHGPELIARIPAGHKALKALDTLVKVADRLGDSQQCVADLLEGLRPWLPRGVDPRAGGAYFGRHSVDIHPGSSLVGPGAGTPGDEPTLEDRSDTSCCCSSQHGVSGNGGAR